MSNAKAGRLLRANGRWSITHRWLTDIQELKTVCGLTYDENELYDGEDNGVQLFDDSITPDWLNCRGCFESGTAITVGEAHVG